MDILKNNIVLITITFLVFYVSKMLQKKIGFVFLNPILITIAVIILFLKLTGIEYETYKVAGSQIEFWLKPAVVALGFPLYQQIKNIKKQIIPIFVSQIVGSLVGISSVVLIAKMLGGSKEIICSLAPKSVTTPIAIEICKTVGGIPSLTAAIVVSVGIFGSVCGFQILQLGKVKNPISQSLGIGTASHAVGTSRAMEYSANYGAYSTLGLILNGILTALFTPTIVSLLV